MREIEIVKRYLLLRKNKRVGPIYIDGPHYWVCEEGAVNLYDTRQHFTLDQLEDLLNRLEGSLVRKPMDREHVAGNYLRSLVNSD